MTTSLDQRDQVLAAEFAVGALDGDLLAEAQKRYENELAFRHEVDEWSERLQPLLDEITPQEPSPHILGQIQTRLDLVEKPKDSWFAWLNNKFMAAGLALGLFVIAAVGSFNLMPIFFAPQAPLLIAAMTEEGQPISARVENNNANVIIVADLEPDATKDRELWLITDASPNPISLGVINAKGETRLDVASETASLIAEGAVLAISLEPIGGSPSGLPTGPVVASASLVVG